MKKIILIFLLVMIITGKLNAQKSMNWSVEPIFGIGIGHFDIESKNNPVYGANVRYAFTPALSVSANFVSGVFEDKGTDLSLRTFKNNYNQFSLRTNLSFGKLIHLDNLTNKASPFITFGAGVLQSKLSRTGEYSNFGENYHGNDIIYVMGGGLKYYINKRIDAIIQYEFNYTHTDLIDGFNYLHPANRFNDYYSFVTAGVAIKLGNKNNYYQHIDWAEPEDILLADVIMLTGRTDQLEVDLFNLIKYKEEFIKEINLLYATIDSLSEILFVYENKGYYINNVEKGKFYVIGGSYRDLTNAKQAVKKFKVNGYNPFLIPGDEFDLFRVAIDVFDNEQTALNKLDKVKAEFNENAWLFKTD